VTDDARFATAHTRRNLDVRLFDSCCHARILSDGATPREVRRRRRRGER
jgi:hypothetical protein